MSFSVNQIKDTLDAIIDCENVQTLFHPIGSVLQRRVVAFEALTSFVSPFTGEKVPTSLLFEAAEETERIVALDRLCRRKGIEAFQKVHDYFPDGTVFVNFEASILDRGVVGSGLLARLVDSLGLDPGCIVIEIVESKVHDLANLLRFVNTYRSDGFLVALDDIGVGHSNLERIASVKPDVLKADRSLITNIHEDYHKQEIFGSIVQLGHRLGSLVVAEGVETEAEALQVLDLGADLIQGYYWRHPGPFAPHLLEQVDARIGELADLFRRRLLNRRYEERLEADAQMRIAVTVARQICADSQVPLDTVLKQTIDRFPSIECMYVLNAEGLQVSGTVFNPGKAPSHGRLLFRPAEQGSDHSLKEYFIGLRPGLPCHITQPYISLATGRFCRTLSLYLDQAVRPGCLLCVDFDLNA